MDAERAAEKLRDLEERRQYEERMNKSVNALTTLLHAMSQTILPLQGYNLPLTPVVGQPLQNVQSGIDPTVNTYDTPTHSYNGVEIMSHPPMEHLMLGDGNELATRSRESTSPTSNSPETKKIKSQNSNVDSDHGQDEDMECEQPNSNIPEALVDDLLNEIETSSPSSSNSDETVSISSAEDRVSFALGPSVVTSSTQPSGTLSTMPTPPRMNLRRRYGNTLSAITEAADVTNGWNVVGSKNSPRGGGRGRGYLQHRSGSKNKGKGLEGVKKNG